VAKTAQTVRWGFFHETGTLLDHCRLRKIAQDRSQCVSERISWAGRVCGKLTEADMSDHYPISDDEDPQEVRFSMCFGHAA
jgi:hypothetical protein